MKKFLISIFILSLLIVPLATSAGCCGCDPVYEYSVKGEVKSAVWVRDEACVDTGAVIDTLNAGEVVQITHKTDGWYKVITPDGKIGWSGEQFFTITDKKLTKEAEPSAYVPVATEEKTTTSSESNSSLARLKGYILLQVEENGEAYYYYPIDNTRYYLGRPADAFAIMREKGLGIAHNELVKYLNSKFPSRLSGRILLDVEQNGEAYYVYPKDLKGYYLGRPADAFAIMREKGLGISNDNLGKIKANVAPLVLGEKYGEEDNDDSQPDEVIIVTPPNSSAGFVSSGLSVPGDGSFQKGSVPSGFDYALINQYVLDRINKERTQRGQAPIVSDQRMVDTASVWAFEMYQQGKITHTRVPENMMAREWVWANFKIEFAPSWGWLYENIGGGSYSQHQGINESVMASMDNLFDYFMSEEPYNGIHYQTIMHDKLTHIGVGFYFDGSDDSGKLYTVLHYGALYGQVPVISKVW